jgi:hypothetical protein
VLALETANEQCSVSVIDDTQELFFQLDARAKAQTQTILPNTSLFSLVQKFINSDAKIKWPVLEIGKNSVMPSIIPMMAALSSSKRSMLYPN